MKEHYSAVHRFVGFLCLFFLLIYGPSLSAQVSFSQTLLNYNGNQNLSGGVTGMMFGPDNRLYVTSLHGKVNIFSIERNGTNDYQVTDVEVLDDIQDIVNHDDDGTACSGSFFQCNNRETIGIVVTGSAQNPVFYVSSSDVRIGAGSGGGNGDVGLDTNSGVITRFSWTGSSWDVVDIVRGLPRSEENHATNGLDLVTIGGKPYLLVAQGGHTNGGGPSVNFVFSTEYALAAAVLAIDLEAIDSLPVQLDNGRKYIYDLPTLDDPTRPNANGITDPDTPGYDGVDVNDPWGGNDGLNQAKVVPNGPVKIFSPGYRNAYDLVVTKSGALYVTDNGANGGWGGFPVNEGTANVNNDYDSNEPGSQSYSGGEHINNKDHLQLVTTDLSSYVFGQYYGGHPNPVRANPSGAGLYTAPGDGNAGAVFRTQIYDPSSPGSGYTSNPAIALPADWPPVPLELANVVEGDWRGPDEDNPDGPLDGEIAVWGTNTNGIAEYRASNFNGAMQGDLLATASNGNIRRVQLTANGQLENLNQSFLSGTKGYILGIATTDDDEIFPGTIWTGDLSGNIQVFEPLDFVECILPGSPGYEPTADNDFDGYTNQDEIDNGTDICNGGSQPSDFDSLQGGTLVSDLNDTDDDFDGIPDVEDPFQLGDPSTGGSDAFSLPVANDFFNYQQGLGGYLGLGLTGFMNSGIGNGNWLNYIDRRDDPNDPNPNDVMGGAPGIVTMHMTSGTALGTTNTQEKGLQYGAQVDASTGIFRITGGMVGFTGASRLYGNTAATNGELGFFIGDGTQSNYIKFVVNTNGFVVQQEINDIPGTPISVGIAESNRPESGILFHFIVDPTTGTVNFEYQIDGASPVQIVEVSAMGTILEAIQNPGTDLALGLIGTSNTEGVELEGSWDFLNISGSSPTVVQNISDLEKIVGSSDEIIDLNTVFDDNQGVVNLNYEITNNTNPEIGAAIVGSTLTISFPSTTAQSTITVRATDGESLFVETSFTVTVIEEGIVLYRVNAGGPAITSIDDGMDWVADQTSNNSPFLSEPGSNSTYVGGITNLHSTVDANVAPLGIFNTERFDTTSGAPNMTYSFPVPNNGNYEIRLYMGNGYSGTSQPGDRIFDVLIEGIDLPLLKDIDLSATYGHGTGGVVSRIVKVSDGVIDIEFLHGAIENPLVNGIEILDVADNDTPIYVFDIPNQSNNLGEQLNGSLIVDANGGDGNLTFTAEGLPPGLFIEPTNGQIGGTVEEIAIGGSPYTVEITVDDNDGTTHDAVSTFFTWVISETQFELNINAGGPALVHEGVDYGADTYFTGGKSYINGSAQLPLLYQSERSSSERFYSYDIPVPNGDYIVSLHMAEIYFGATGGGPGGEGQRVFDMTLEGTLILDDYDITLEVGSETPVVKSYPVTVTDGEVNLYLSALDADGGVDQPKLSAIRILGDVSGNSAPVASAEADVIEGEVPLTVNFTGSNSIDDTGISSYQWDFGDGSAISTEADPAHIYTNAGNYSAVLTVTDGDGQQDTDTVTITVTVPVSAPPSALAQADQVEGDAPLEVQFTGSNSVDDMGISSYQWNFGDGSAISTDADPVHTYANTGTYSAVLTVTDADGQTDTDTVSINVTGPISEGVTSLTLVDASTDTDLFNISDGQQLDLGPTGGQSLNVRANTLGAPGSVLLELTGPVTVSRREGVAPYALFGDISGNYEGQDLPLGDYTLTATAYNGGTASSGVLGQPLTITFSVVTGLGAKTGSFSTVDSPEGLELESNNNSETVPFEIILFPNPGATNITLVASSPDIELRDLMIFNSSGQLVRTFAPSNFMEGRSRYSFPINNLQSGVYHLKMMTIDGRIYFKQLIVRK